MNANAKRRWLGSGILCAFVLAPALSGSEPAAKKTTAPAAAPTSPQRMFATPDEAADALIAASASDDLTALKEILGKDGEDLVVTADPVQDKNRTQEFSEKAREKKTVVPNGKEPTRAILQVGNEDWPMPIPIVKNKSGKWFFDSKAGRKEILYRRIGGNELDAIQVCLGYVEAQHAYALEKHDDSNLNQYAQKVISTPGKHDGLVWRNPDGTSGGPIGEPIDRAISEGYTSKAEPYHGYYFKILKGQGPAAPLGQLDFVMKGVMIGGFALVAAPADYRATGVMTFLVSHDGVVYQKDLGPKTLEQFQKMERLNPDKTWTPVDRTTASPDVASAESAPRQ
jgi:hypothetical protein